MTSLATHWMVNDIEDPTIWLVSQTAPSSVVFFHYVYPHPVDQSRLGWSLSLKDATGKGGHNN